MRPQLDVRGGTEGRHTGEERTGINRFHRDVSLDRLADDRRCLLRMRRAGDVGDQAAGARGCDGRGQQLGLKRGQASDVGRLAPPTDFRTSAQRSEPGARSVHDDPVEAPERPRGGAAVGANVHSGGNQVVTQDVQRCRTVQGNVNPDYWDVTYVFRGREHRAQLASPPGPTLTVNGNGEPRV